MATNIKIAPDLDGIKREGNVFCCEFNDMAIRWAIAADLSDMSEEKELELKKLLRDAIGMSGKSWQLPWALNQCLNCASEVYVNGNKVEYPKE